MELREFAERVLFATTLEEKFLSPDVITDEHPGPALVNPAGPGRPSELQFKAQGTTRDTFPGTRHLEKSRERGRLLHFFANHELLATELMALVLLRFPDAPAAFRKGVLQTLKDEQQHTRLYLKRMKECGIHFGELPVSGYFWRTVSPMENPMDYVASLCLTFEQANLDFARHFAKGFARVGDKSTSRLLEKIYHDEIGHVAYGLKWFRRWKDPDESDWEAFCRTLKFPLSPQRAKGFSLNVEGRRAAGLDAQFISQLNVYSQSKGRTPSVFVFNPFAEGYIAKGKAFYPKKPQAQLAHDLENLPQFLCRQDDIVLVERRPSVEFLSRIKNAGFPLPEFVEMGESLTRPSTFTRLRRDKPATFSHRVGEGLGLRASRGLAERKLGRLRPWAWSPDSMELLSPIFANVTAERRTTEQRFNPKIAQLYSKAWGAEFLQKVFAPSSRGNEAHFSKSEIGNRNASIQSWLCIEQEIGVAVNSLAEALDVIVAIRQRGHHKIVIKQAFGLAGGNALRLFEPRLLDSQRAWMARSFAGGHQLVVEPWLDRLADFSVQLEMTTDGLKLCGYTELICDAKGQYQGNRAEPHHRKRIPANIVTLFREPPDISSRLLEFYAVVRELLEAELRRADYIGPIGVDACVYRDAVGATRLKPVIEINPRYTMGRLTVELMKRVCPGSHGLFRLINRAALRSEGFDDFTDFAHSLNERFPVRLEGEPVARIREGAPCLNDPAVVQTCLAVFRVAREVPDFDFA